MLKSEVKKIKEWYIKALKDKDEVALYTNFAYYDSNSKILESLFQRCDLFYTGGIQVLVYKDEERRQKHFKYENLEQMKMEILKLKHKET